MRLNHFRTFGWAPRHGYQVIRSEIMKITYLNQYSLSDTIVKSYEHDIYIL